MLRCSRTMPVLSVAIGGPSWQAGAAALAYAPFRRLCAVQSTVQTTAEIFVKGRENQGSQSDEKAQSMVERRPKGYWRKREHREEFLRAFAAKRGLRWAHKEDWEQVTVRDIKKEGGSGVVAFFGGSIRDALADHFPEMDVSGMRSKAKKGFWDIAENRRRFLEEFAAARGGAISDCRFWASVSGQDIIDGNGIGLLDKYKRSVFDMLVGEVPEVEWDAVTCRPSAPPGHWDSAENRRAFMERVASEKDIKSISDWKSITYGDIVELGGSALARSYPSLAALIADTFPEAVGELNAHQLTKRLPKNHWNSDVFDKNVRLFLEHVKKELRLEGDEDWARVSVDQLGALGGYALINRGMKLVDMLRIAYPTINWDPSLFTGGSKMKAAQRNLLVKLRGIFEEQP